MTSLITLQIDEQIHDSYVYYGFDNTKDGILNHWPLGHKVTCVIVHYSSMLNNVLV